MLIFMFSDVHELVEWREAHIKQYNEVPRITAKYIGEEKLFTAYVSLGDLEE